VVLRQEHRAGEKMFVDWAGDTIPIHVTWRLLNTAWARRNWWFQIIRAPVWIAPAATSPT